jgi:hypothetical protein
MPYLSSPLFNLSEVWRGVINRKIELLHGIAHEFFLPGEQYDLYLDAECLGVWVAVASPRPEALLKAIKKEAFPRFGFPGVHFDGSCHWTHFRAMVGAQTS